MMPLTFSSVGQTAVIQRITGKYDVRQHLAELGFVAGEKVTIIFNIQLRYTPTWLVNENFSFRLCFRSTKHPTRIILEHSENVFSIKVERHTLMIGKQDVNRSRIDFHNVHN